jgi:hypothetical protein
MSSIGQVPVFYRRDFDVDVNPVHERAGDLGPLALKSMEENVIKGRKRKYRITFA